MTPELELDPSYFRDNITSAVKRAEMLRNAAQRMMMECGERRRQSLNEGLKPDHPLMEMMMDQRRYWSVLLVQYQNLLNDLQARQAVFSKPPEGEPVPVTELTIPIGVPYKVTGAIADGAVVTVPHPLRVCPSTLAGGRSDRCGLFAFPPRCQIDINTRQVTCSMKALEGRKL
jgi:hypothetical protein